MSSFFDDLSEDRPDKLNIKPFHAIKKDDKKEVLDWCKSVIESLQKQAVSRNAKMRRNLETYRGASPYVNRTSIRRSERQFLNRTDKFIVNHLHDMTCRPGWWRTPSHPEPCLIREPGFSCFSSSMSSPSMSAAPTASR